MVSSPESLHFNVDNVLFCHSKDFESYTEDRHVVIQFSYFVFILHKGPVVTSGKSNSNKITIVRRREKKAVHSCGTGKIQYSQVLL